MHNFITVMCNFHRMTPRIVFLLRLPNFTDVTMKFAKSIISIISGGVHVTIVTTTATIVAIACTELEQWRKKVIFAFSKD